MLNDVSINRHSKPTIAERIKQKLHSKSSKGKRLKLNESARKRLQHTDFTIISQNCVGGVLYHDLGLQFLSPTINLAFDGEDFMKFISNLDYYLSVELKEYATDIVEYPVGILDDVEVRFVHYKSFAEAKQKWDERKKRINRQKILVIATDRDGMFKKELLEKFDALPYSKIMYTSHDPQEYNWMVYCKCWKNKPSVGVMTGIADFGGHRFYEKYVDIVEVINSISKEV